jgi:hypothetical protein
MSADIFVLASVIYWGVYVMAFVVGIPCAMALLFGVFQTAKWIKRGDTSNPHKRSSSKT